MSTETEVLSNEIVREWLKQNDESCQICHGAMKRQSEADEMLCDRCRRQLDHLMKEV